MTIRAICTDIDGTLLDSRRELSDRTIAAVKRLPDHIPFILCSSRMPSAMRHLQAELNLLHQPLICYNGGYILHYQHEGAVPAVIDSVTIPASICSEILGLARGTAIHVSLYHEDNWYAPQEDQWTAREARNTKVQPTIIHLEEVIQNWQQNGQGAHKVMCMGDAAEIKVLADALEARFPQDLHVYKSKDTYLEIAPRIISKATALELLLQQQYRIPLSDVMAFGDNYNDIEMLAAVGRGVAVGNARPEVKAVAAAITRANIEDGVALAIEECCLR